MQTADNLVVQLLQRRKTFGSDIRSHSLFDDLTMKHISTIELIGQIGEPSLTELADALQITKASASVLVSRIEDRGFVVRRKSDIDKRLINICLTDKGQQVCRLHSEVDAQFAQWLTSSLSATEQQILALLLARSIS